MRLVVCLRRAVTAGALGSGVGRAPRTPPGHNAVRQRILLTAVLGVAALVVPACSSTPDVTIPLPPVNGQFDYQLGGAYTPTSSVAILDRDRSEPPVAGKYNICYVNAFQTQPNEKSFWTDSHSDLLLKDGKGAYVIDPDWPDEYILDTSTTAKQTAIAGILDGWIDGCAKAGFQAIEPDNLDSWTRSKKRLTQANNVGLATLLARHAHDKGLAIAQKNTAELGPAGKATVKFDFAITEECQEYDECGDYTDVYGKNVIEIEYTDNKAGVYADACAARGADISVILRDRDVVTPDDEAYHYEFC